MSNWEDKRNGIRNCSTVIYLLLSVLSIALLFVSRGGLLGHYLHSDTRDTFMDYFNVVALGSEGNPYLGGGNNYPPLCYVVTKALNKMVPQGIPLADDVASCGGKGFYLRNSEYAMFPYIILLIACVLIIAYCVQQMTKRSNGVTRIVPVMGVLLSGPFLFLIERGNLIIIALASTFFYLTYRDSGSNLAKNVAYFAIAFAAGLKIYPFIFSFLELREGDRKAFLKIISWTCLLYGVPFLYFGGVEAVKGMLTGLTEFVDSTTSIGLGNQYGATAFLRSIAEMTGLEIVGKYSGLAVSITLMGGVASILCAQKKWQAALAAGMLCVMVPSVSFTYALVFLLPGLVMASTDEGPESSLETLVYCLTLFSVLFVFTPFIPFLGNNPAEVRYPLTWGCLFQNAALVVSFCVLLFVSISGFFKARKTKSV